MILMNYLYEGFGNWEAVASFVIRGALSENKSTYIKPPKHMYQKLLVLVWSWMMVVLISAYQGNLLAIITKPKMSIPFTSANGMVQQTQMKWSLGSYDTFFSSYAKSHPPGTTVRQMHDRAIRCSEDCAKKVNPRYNAHINDITQSMKTIANDFTETGTCNYYLTQDRILATDSVLALPVSVIFNLSYVWNEELQYVLFQKRSPILDDINSFIHMAK